MASAFAAVIARNPVHEESREGVYGLLRQTFDAFGSSARSDLVYLKALYCFARDEGYPVKQEWAQGLPPATRASASEMLNKPVAGPGGLPRRRRKPHAQPRRLFALPHGDPAGVILLPLRRLHGFVVSPAWNSPWMNAPAR